MALEDFPKTVLILFVIAGVVFLSALILTLVDWVGGPGGEVEVLSTEFDPFVGGGFLKIGEFEFCSEVNEFYECEYPAAWYYQGDSVYFKFWVESYGKGGKVELIENYRLLGSNGELVLDTKAGRGDFNYNVEGKEDVEQVFFADYFILSPDMELGTYTLELFISNPLLEEEAKITQKFEVLELVFEPGWEPEYEE